MIEFLYLIVCRFYTTLLYLPFMQLMRRKT